MWFLLSLALASPKGDVKAGTRALDSGDHNRAIKLLSAGLSERLSGTVELKARSARLRAIAQHPDTDDKITHLTKALEDYLWIVELHPGAPPLLQQLTALELTTRQAAAAADVGVHAPCVESIPLHDPRLPRGVLSGLAQCAAAVHDYAGGRAVVKEQLSEFDRTGELDASLLLPTVALASGMCGHDDVPECMTILDRVDAQLQRIESALTDPRTELGTLSREEVLARLKASQRATLSARAAAHRSQGDLEAAIEAFDKVIALDPASVDERVIKGDLLLQLDREEEGLEALEKAIQLAPTDPRAFARVGGHWFGRAQEVLLKMEALPERDRRGRRTLQAIVDERLAHARDAYQTSVRNGGPPDELKKICALQEDEKCAGADE